MPINVVTFPLQTTEAGSTLPAIIDGARKALDAARSFAEVLEAKVKAQLAHDAARRAERLAKQQEAHDQLVTTARRMQGDAVELLERADMRLAEEIEAARQRGELPRQHDNQHTEVVTEGNNLDSIRAFPHRRAAAEAAQTLKAERAVPGIVRQAIDTALDQGRAPTRADVRRAIREATLPIAEARMRQMAIERGIDPDDTEPVKINFKEMGIQTADDFYLIGSVREAIVCIERIMQKDAEHIASLPLMDTYGSRARSAAVWFQKLAALMPEGPTNAG